MIKCMIVDDSDLAREELRYLLKAYGDIEVTCEASNADEAIEMLSSRPSGEVDLMFLDIQMPGKSGFELLNLLEPCPDVIFTTAYDQYAIKAFEYNAIDYLLKPIKPQRLAKTIDGLKEKQRTTESASHGELLSLGDQVFVKDGERCWFVRLEDIRLLETEGSYTTIYFKSERALLSKSLSYLESRLDPKVFFRANRSQVINLQKVNDAQVDVAGLLLVLECGTEVQLTRRQAQLFKSMKSF